MRFNEVQPLGWIWVERGATERAVKSLLSPLNDSEGREPTERRLGEVIF